MPDASAIGRHTFFAPPAGNDCLADDGLVARSATGDPDTAAELHRNVLELEHRLKNVLCNVLALVGSAERDATVDKHVLRTLSTRVKALSSSHVADTQEGGASVELTAMIAAALTDTFGQTRVALQGAPIVLNARAASLLESVVHELATNAAKHGALSQGDGQVVLSWFCLESSGRKFAKFRWQEFGGPNISAEPGVGFGTQLMTSLIAGDLNGAIEREWKADGAIIEFVIPFEAITVVSETDAADAC